MAQQTLEPLLSRWERRIQLDAADRAAVLALPLTRKSFSRDAYLIREGDPATHCSLLLSGMAYRQKLLGDGNRQIVSFHIPGEFIDLQNLLLGESDHNVQTLTRSELAVIPKAALQALVDARPRVARAVWLDTLIDASIFREWVVNVGRRRASARIAHLLCELALRFRTVGLCPDDVCEFPITQEQMADATGLTTVHTNRTLQALRRAGVIALSSSKLTVLDWGRLVEIGDFSERYLHHAV